MNNYYGSMYFGFRKKDVIKNVLQKCRVANYCSVYSQNDTVVNLKHDTLKFSKVKL